MQRLAWILLLAAGCSKSADRSPADTPGEPPAGAAGSVHHRKHEDRREPVVASAPPLALDVRVKGATATWHQEAFDKVPRYTKGNDGEARDVWSLRELVHQLVGPTAQVTSVTGDDGTRAVDRAAWDDASRTPLLHTTRRGTLKFRWADANGRWGESEVKDVVRIEVAQ
ncbi:MAG TPA: hypothetical protein VHN14_00765 [Kofleriaceae bacterium]|jgi:hypothetical protein|nr:hypothetical protein [Kofleriaceae bacterium]